MDRIDVLIATALEMERDAVRAVATFSATQPNGVRSWQDMDVNNPPEYCVGKYALPQGGSINIALARPTRMGGIFMSNVVSTLIERLKPRCLAMCGVCAGNPRDLALGDIVIASAVFQYDEGKRLDGGGFQGDLFPIPMDIRWLERAKALRFEGLPSHGIASEDDARLWLLERFYHSEDPRELPAFNRYFPAGTWQERVSRLEAEGLLKRTGRTFVITDDGKEFVNAKLAYNVDPPLRLPFVIQVGPMASGNAVVKDGVTWDTLKRSGQRSAIALEMEAASIGASSYSRSYSKWIVVKGVMDYADPKKDDRYKPFAARASAEVLLRFLEENAASIRDESESAAINQPSRAPAAREPAVVPVAARQQNGASEAYPFRFPDDKDHPHLTVLVVCRENGSDALVTVTERGLILRQSDLAERSGKSVAADAQRIGDNVFRLNVQTAFTDRAAMIARLRAVCLADIAIFDVTGTGAAGIEPGIMLLLGVRSVVRRGVSICSVDHDPEELFGVKLPYNLQQLNIASHGAKLGEIEAAERLAVKLANGLHDLDHDLTYLDLPAFDSIRTLGGDLRDYEPIPFYRGPLYLGPFDAEFENEYYRKLEPEIQVLLDRIARDKDGRDYQRPRVFRLIDYDRARMVSQSLYHSIRRHDFCLIDWTWLRPNVFFEFGVRLASRRSGDVHIMANVDRAGTEPNGLGLRWPKRTQAQGLEADASKLAQTKGLLGIFAPIEYKPHSVASVRATCSAILDRWRATRNSTYDNGTLFDEIARTVVSPKSGAIGAVVEFLRKRASLTYLHDQDTLLGTLLYEEHNSGLQKAAIAQSIAMNLAALFLALSSGGASGGELPPQDEIVDLAQEIRRLGKRVGTEEDVRMLGDCLTAIRKTFTLQ